MRNSKVFSPGIKVVVIKILFFSAMNIYQLFIGYVQIKISKR
jgi:hypothetical protein